MFETVRELVKDNWASRRRIFGLALFDLKKRSRGTVLSYAWLFIRPAIYIFCFWFALDIGLRAGGATTTGNAPYFVWLCAGLIPWFFMQDMLTKGSNVLSRYPYLVKKIKFPIGAIPSIFSTATLLVQLMFQAVLLTIFALNGMEFDVYLLQVPILLVLMYAFWTAFSLLLSHLTAVSKDVANLMAALSTPFFWLSGVIFDVKAISVDSIQWLLMFNPVTFFVTSFRGALCEDRWFWEDPVAFGCFAVVFLLTAVCAVMVYRRLSKEVADVL